MNQPTDSSETINLYVKSGVNRANQNLPAVLIEYGKWHQEITVTTARARATAIIETIALAQTEERIAKSLTKASFPKPKGFDLNVQKRYQEKYQQEFTQILMAVRANRPVLIDGLDAIYGYHTQQSLINLSWYGDVDINIQMTLADARGHASQLLEAAESAQTDRWIYCFFREVDVAEEEIAQLLTNFVDFRNRGSLEDLYGINTIDLLES